MPQGRDIHSSTSKSAVAIHSFDIQGGAEPDRLCFPTIRAVVGKSMQRVFEGVFQAMFSPLTIRNCRAKEACGRYRCSFSYTPQVWLSSELGQTQAMYADPFQMREQAPIFT